MKFSRRRGAGDPPELASPGTVAPGKRFPALKALSGGQAHPQEVILNWNGTLEQ